MARKTRERKTASAKGGAAYTRDKGLVGTLVYWTKEERHDAKRAALEAGFDSLQAFCRAALTERAAKTLAERGVEKKEK